MKPDPLAESIDVSAADAAAGPNGNRVMRVGPWPAPAGGRRGEETPGRAQLAAMRLLVQRAPFLVWTTDAELHLTWGLKHRSLSAAGERLGRLLHSREEGSSAVAAHVRALAGEPAEFELAAEGGTLEGRVEPLPGPGGEVEGAVGMAILRSEQDRREREELVRAGLLDPLTQLPTRTVFVERLRRATASTDWCLEGLFVLLLDVDRFRDLNERYGYEACDRLLSGAAARLQRRLRPADTLARYGPDEFAVLLGGIRDARDALMVAARLQRELAAAFDVQGTEVRISASVGIAAGLAGQRPERLVREAERALARARIVGRGGCQVFHPGRDTRETLLGNVETALRRALDVEDLQTHYRPTVLRKEGKVAGFEVLLWKKRTEAELEMDARKPPERPAS